MEFPFGEVGFKVSFDQAPSLAAEEQVYYSDFLAATLDVRKQIRKATDLGTAVPYGDRGCGSRRAGTVRDSYGSTMA